MLFLSPEFGSVWESNPPDQRSTTVFFKMSSHHDQSTLPWKGAKCRVYILFGTQFLSIYSLRIASWTSTEGIIWIEETNLLRSELYAEIRQEYLINITSSNQFSCSQTRQASTLPRTSHRKLAKSIINPWVAWDIATKPDIRIAHALTCPGSGPKKRNSKTNAISFFHPLNRCDYRSFLIVF